MSNTNTEINIRILQPSKEGHISFSARFYFESEHALKLAIERVLPLLLKDASCTVESNEIQGIKLNGTTIQANKVTSLRYQETGN